MFLRFALCSYAKVHLVCFCMLLCYANKINLLQKSILNIASSQTVVYCQFIMNHHVHPWRPVWSSSWRTAHPENSQISNWETRKISSWKQPNIYLGNPKKSSPSWDFVPTGLPDLLLEKVQTFPGFSDVLASFKSIL